MKFSICLLVAVCAVVSVQANPPPACEGRCEPKKSSRTVCIRNRLTNICTKLRACELRERNCKLTDLLQPIIRVTNMRRCRNVIKPYGRAVCAPLPTPGPRERCLRRRCIDNRQSVCWTTSDGRCTLLTVCEAQRRNCVAGPKDRLTRALDERCKDRKRGDGLRKCSSKIIVIKD